MTAWDLLPGPGWSRLAGRLGQVVAGYLQEGGRQVATVATAATTCPGVSQPWAACRTCPGMEGQAGRLQALQWAGVGPGRGSGRTGLVYDGQVQPAAGLAARPALCSQIAGGRQDKGDSASTTLVR